MSVKLTLGRSGALYDDPMSRKSGVVPADAPDVVELGPFEYVELTYEMLRVGPDGLQIGEFRDGYWYLDDDPHPFSDLDIYAEDH